MPLIDFWSKHPRPGVHPEDLPYLQPDDQVRWESSAEAKENELLLAADAKVAHRDRLLLAGSVSSHGSRNRRTVPAGTSTV